MSGRMKAAAKLRGQYRDEWRERAEAAEARCARLQEQLDAARDGLMEIARKFTLAQEDVRILEARCARMRQALQEIADLYEIGPAARIARQALAGPDTPTHRKQNVEYWRARSRVAGEECARLQQALEAARREAGRAQDVRVNRTRIIGNIALIADEALAGQPTAAEGPDTPACDHEWVQEHGTSSRYCVLCGAGPDTPAEEVA